MTSGRRKAAQNEAIYASVDGNARAITLAESNLAEVDAVIGAEHVSYERVLDLTSAAVRERLGIPPEDDLTGVGYSITHQIGDLVQRLGYDAILAPTRHGIGNNLVILRRQL